MDKPRKELSDRAAELKLVREIADGEYNRDVVIEATEDGLVIDNYVIVPWEWIRGANQILATSYDSQKIPLPAESSAAPRQHPSD